MADVELKLSADASAAGKEIAGFRKQYADMVRTLQTPLRQIDSLRTTQEATKKTAAEFFAAKQRVSELRTAIASAGQPVKSFERDLNVAERTLARVTLQFDRQKESLRQQRDQLRAAGVDTRNLAGEQQRLQAAMAKAIGSGRNEQAVNSAVDSLGVGRARELQAELVRLNSQYQTLRSSGTLTARELSLAQRTYTQRVRETQQAMRELYGEQSRLKGLGTGAAGYVGQAAGAYGLLRGIQGVVRISDSWTELSDRIKLATGSQEEYESGMARLRDISDRTFTSMSANAESFINALGPLRDRGFSNPEVLKFVEAVGLGMVASAAKGERAVSVINQFSNALQDGTLQGDAFKAMIRNTPALANALSQALGKTREELTAMATAGELTTDVWVPALISQTDELGKAVDNMNIVVGDALTRLNNAWENAISQADPTPLVEAIQNLTKTISDPLIVENLVKIASALVQLTSVAISAGSGFATMGDNIGYAAAQASGNVDKLTKLEKTLKEVNNAITGDSFLGSNTMAQLLKFFSPQMLEDWKNELEQKIADVNAEIQGMTGEQYRAQQEADRKAHEARAAELKELQRIEEERLSSLRDRINKTSKLQQESIKEAEQTARKRVAIEREAAKDLEAAKKVQLDTEKRYADALAKLRNGGNQGGSFTDANTLKLNAQQALKAGDVEGAKRTAQSALDMLQRLQDAGENTYGFEGIIKELYRIEKAADQINIDKAQNSFDEAQKRGAELKSLLDDLKKVTITVKMDEAALAEAEAKIQHLAGLAKLTADGKSFADLDGATQSQATPQPATPVSRPTGIPTSTQPVVKAEAEITGIRQDASTASRLSPVEVDVLPKGIYRDGENSFTDIPPLDVILKMDQEAAAETEGIIQALAARFQQELTIPVRPVVQGAGAPAEGIEGHATGGYIQGPGTGTSDSILARLSNGEFVVRADAVRRYGTDYLHRLNSMRLPKFAEGGLVSNALSPSVPQLAGALEGQANGGLPMETLGRYEFVAGGETVPVYVERDDQKKMKILALKFGRSKN